MRVSSKEPELSIVTPYYDNPKMLRKVLQWYGEFSEETKERIELVIVDDGSPNYPPSRADLEKATLKVQLFRVREDIPWNQHAARNIGARHSAAEMLILTDIDHLFPETSISRILDIKMASYIYKFQRQRFADKAVVRSHVNTFLMSKMLFWDIGGYDEDYCGDYGTDKFFRRRAFAKQNPVLLDDVVYVVGSADISDANTQIYSREITRTMRWRWRKLAISKFFRLRPKVVLFRQEYDRVI